MCLKGQRVAIANFCACKSSDELFGLYNEAFS